MTSIKMKPILKEDLLLQKYAKAKTTLIFDYDGTLCPIVDHSSGATLSRETKKLLKKLVRLYPCVVLSGRSLLSLEKMVGGIGFQSLVGNHGIEFEHARVNAVLEKRVLVWKKILQGALKDGRIQTRGVELELKNVSLSLHYRMSPHPRKVALEIATVLRELPGLRVVGGKDIFNLLPDIRKDKGTAVLELRRRLKCDYAFFAGDDITDEDVFRLKNKAKILDVHVGRSQKSQARYYLPRQEEMNQLIEKWIKFRV